MGGFPWLGVVLSTKGSGKGRSNLRALWPAESGFLGRFDPRVLIASDLDGDGAKDLLLGQNEGKAVVFRGLDARKAAENEPR